MDVKCDYCGGIIHENTDICPRCGASNSAKVRHAEELLRRTKARMESMDGEIQHNAIKLRL